MAAVLTDILRFAVIGAAAGGLYAVMGLGLVVVFRASRVVNFGHAAIGLTAAYVFNDVRGGQPTLIALGAGVLAGVALGALVDQAVMRPLQGASPLTRAIGAIGVLITLQAALHLRYGDHPTLVATFLPINAVDLGGVSVGFDRLIVLGLCLLSTAALYIGYRFTRFGVATSALAENPRSLAALGWASSRIGVANWAVGGALAAIAGILISPITGLTPTLAVSLLLPALTAALLGNLASFPLTLLGGLAIGIAQAEVSRFAPVQGLQDAVPFIGMMLVLAARGSSLPGREHVAERLPRVGSGRTPWVAVGLATVLGVVLIQWILSDAWVAALSTTLTVAIILLSLVVVTGYTGQLSLASFALAGTGALIAAQLVSGPGWPFMPAMAVGMTGAGAVGLLVGLPAVRTRGVSLAIVTLGLAVTIQSMILDNVDVSHGINGLPVGSLSIFGVDLDALFYPRRYALVVLVVLLVLSLGVLNLRRSAMGRRMVAVRVNERAAAALGISVPGTKLYAFVLSGVVAAAGGILLAFTNSIVVLSNPGSSFAPFNSLFAVAQLTIGGLGYVGGALVGSGTQTGGIGNQVLEFLGRGDWLALIGGLLLLLTVITAPDGVVANMQRTFRPLNVRRAASSRPRGLPADSEPDDVHPVGSASLTVRDLTVAFGADPVLDRLSLDLAAGTVLGVIGPNGAGKTTLVDAITGYTRPRAGSIRLDERELTRLTPAARCKLGVSRSFQSLELFESLTVLDNLLVADERTSWHSTISAVVAPSRSTLSTRIWTVVTELGLDEHLDSSPADLPYGHRRLLAIARALAARPRMLLLDEPAAGLGEQERRQLRVLIRRLAEQWGVGILLVDHDVDLVMDVSDHVVALDFGRVIASGAPDAVRRDAGVIVSYLGTDEDNEDGGRGELSPGAGQLPLRRIEAR